MDNKISVYKNNSRKKYDMSEEKREWYRDIYKKARVAKISAQNNQSERLHPINTPQFDPEKLMPKIFSNPFNSLSLFSGGGGLDLGFDLAGYKHIASYELIPICKDTFANNRPLWEVYCGPNEGDVTKVDWAIYKNREIDVIHGGPPCQPFSVAGEQKGIDDDRNMWGEFIRAINIIKPRAFVAENVMGLLSPKFDEFVQSKILSKLKDYHILRFEMNAADFGVPQARRRVFFVGFNDFNDYRKFSIPNPTHFWKYHKNSEQTLFDTELPKTFGARAALGLPSIGFDSLAPTLRSAFTGKRHTTSILNSSAGKKAWEDLCIWPNGVQLNREKASAYPAKNGHFRLSIQDVGLLQGFPESWSFAGAVYQVLGQIGNSVSPPVAYHVAKNVYLALT